MRIRIALLAFGLVMLAGASVAQGRPCGSVPDPRGWRVTGDLRGSSDRYMARKPGKLVRWRF